MAHILCNTYVCAFDYVKVHSDNQLCKLDSSKGFEGGGAINDIELCMITVLSSQDCVH